MRFILLLYYVHDKFLYNVTLIKVDGLTGERSSLSCLDFYSFPFKSADDFICILADAPILSDVTKLLYSSIFILYWIYLSILFLQLFCHLV